MAGTKNKPCEECKWDNWETYLNADYDPCYKCFKGSEWTKESNSTCTRPHGPDSDSDKQG